jgi:hypothetical protein
MLCCICHSPSGTTRAKSSPFAAEGDQLIFLAQRTVKPGHTVSKVSALEIFFELPFKVKRKMSSLDFFIEKNLLVIFSN